MSFLNRFVVPRAAKLPARDVQVLTLAPAVMRMSIAGNDATTELDALAVAASKVGYPDGFSPERVFAAATELARVIAAGGVEALTDKMKADLSPKERADAVRLALAALFSLPTGESGDIGILAGMAKHIGMSEAVFEALFKEAKARA